MRAASEFSGIAAFECKMCTYLSLYYTFSFIFGQSTFLMSCMISLDYGMLAPKGLVTLLLGKNEKPTTTAVSPPKIRGKADSYGTEKLI